MSVDLLLHHGHHVEGVAHGVEAQDARQLLETGSVGERNRVRLLSKMLLKLNQSECGSHLFSARTFLPHWEQVYMLSPSRVSLMVTSSRDS